MSGRRRCGGTLGPHDVQLGSLHSSSMVVRGSWVRVGRRCVGAGRCFEETEAVREIGLCRGLLSLLCCLCSVPVGRRGLGAGLCEETGAVVGRTGGLRDVALGAESAELFEAAVKLEYPESLRTSLLAGIIFSRRGACSEFRSLERFVLTLACAMGDALRGKLSSKT
jgi:hypothetical protein